MRHGYWKLDTDMKTPVECTAEEWAEFMRNNDNRRVAGTHIGDVFVSTVFLAIDHNHSDIGPPVLFETMIFGLDGDEYQARCSTWEDAMKMHEDAVVYAKSKL